MSRLTEKQLAEYRDLRAKVTQPSPWTLDEDEFGRCLVLDANGAWVADVGRAPDDAKFITAAPVMVTNLLREVARLKKLCKEACDTASCVDVLTRKSFDDRVAKVRKEADCG